jgi:phosphoglycerol transferase MdoB-like AlkP superfamily enzyme
MKNVVKGISFLAVPVLSFVLMELYEHNPFAEVRTEAIFFNVLLFELLAWILFGLIGNTGWALCILLLGSMLFGITNHYIMLFRSTPFVPWDIYSVRTAYSVAGNYDFTPDLRMVLVTAAFAALVILVHFWDIRLRGKRRLFALGMTIAPVVLLVLFVARLQDESFQTEHHLYPFLFTPAYMTKVNGMGVTFAMNLAYLKVDRPEGYSAKEAEALLESYREADDAEAAGADVSEDGAAETYPNIIVIMDEAFSDLAVLGDVDASEDYMPFLHRMQEGTENTVTGYLNVSVCGGNTANTEFEFLTGNTMAFLPGGSVPYQQYIKSETPSLASYLSGLGYLTCAMHPYYASGWQRETVYPLLGFGQTYFIEDMQNLSYIRKYVSDRSDMDNIIRIYEEKEAGTPLFLFNVTMQNHGGYTEDYANFTPDITAEGKDSAVLNQYLSLLKRTDAALEHLIAYFKEQDEPTILLFFGDHQPNNAVAKAFSCSDETLRYQVPYLMWANYDIEEGQNVDTSANYLSSHLLREAGVPLYDYQNFLTDLEQAYPILSAARIKTGADASDELLSEYQKIQYYLLFDRKGEQE